MARRTFRGSWLVETIVDLPIVLPPAVAGLGLLLVFGRRGLLGDAFDLSIPFTTLAVILAQTFVSAPFFIRSARTGISNVDLDLEAAARVDGASELQVFRRITAPLAATALAAGLVMAWARALGEFGATIMFAGNIEGRTQTLPLVVYGEFQGGDLDASIAAAAILVLAAFGVLIAVRILHWGRALDTRGLGGCLSAANRSGTVERPARDGELVARLAADRAASPPVGRAPACEGAVVPPSPGAIAVDGDGWRPTASVERGVLVAPDSLGQGHQDAEADRTEAVHQLEELGPADHQRLDRARGRGGRRARPAVDQRDLAEEVAGAQVPDRHAVLRNDELSVDDHVEGVALVALARDLVAVGELRLGGEAGDGLQRALRHAAKERNLRQVVDDGAHQFLSGAAC